MSQLVRDFIMDPNQDLKARQHVFSYYGTFSRAMITMFEVHLANWAPACRVLVDHVGEGYAYVFLAYRCLAGFAILNVINAVFIQQTMKVAQQDHEVMIAMKTKEKDKYAKELQNLFKQLDTSGDGLVTWAELQEVFSNPKLKIWMSILEIDSTDLEGLFRSIDVNGDGGITCDELLAGASRIKGNAKSIDIVHVLAQLKVVDGKLNALVKALPDASAHLQ